MVVVATAAPKVLRDGSPAPPFLGNNHTFFEYDQSNYLVAK